MLAKVFMDHETTNSQGLELCVFSFVFLGFIPLQDKITHSEVGVPYTWYSSSGFKKCIFLSSVIPITFIMSPSYTEPIDTTFLVILWITREKESRYLVRGWHLFSIQVWWCVQRGLGFKSVKPNTIHQSGISVSLFRENGIFCWCEWDSCL